MDANTVKLYYLTGTGNSLKIAKDIGSEVGKHQLVPMAKLMRQEENIVIEGDIIGFIFPVYFARTPAFIEEFIKKSTFGRTSYIFAVANGGGLFGRALKIFEKNINKKGKILNAGFLVRMPGNHPKITSMQKKKPAEYYAKEAIMVRKISQYVKEKDSMRLKQTLDRWAVYFRI